jgi:hypothetical protein
MLIGSGLQALATSGKFKPVALGQIRTAGNKLPAPSLKSDSIDSAAQAHLARHQMLRLGRER